MTKVTKGGMSSYNQHTIKPSPWWLGKTSIHLGIEKQGNETNWMRKPSIDNTLCLASYQNTNDPGDNLNVH